MNNLQKLQDWMKKEGIDLFIVNWLYRFKLTARVDKIYCSVLFFTDNNKK